MMAGLLALLTVPAGADGALRVVAYAELAARLDGAIRFDGLPAGSEPGLSLDHPIRIDGAAVGAGFAGQTRAIRTARDGSRHDDLSTAGAQGPLRLLGHGPGQGLSFAYHRGFGSVAVLPLGPDGFGALSGRGEGSLAVLFDRDQAVVGLRIHSDYPDPLGMRDAARGGVTVIALARDGRVIGRHAAGLVTGITELGLERAAGRADIAGLVVLNTDPGGIAIDDILYARAALMGRPLTAPGTTRRMAAKRGMRTR